MPKRDIAGSRGIVTGASSGIGQAIARELVRRGAHVLAVARREPRLVELQEACSQQALAGRLNYYAGDICQPDVRTAVLEDAATRYDGLDFLVNAAGISSAARFEESTPERLRATMEVNFFAPAELIRGALPVLRRGNRPLIVNIGSILGHRAIPWHADYCASKFALQGLSEAIRPELHKMGIDLLVVSPGTTKTELYSGDEGRAKLPWRQPQGVSPEYVARKTVQAMAAGRREIVPNPSGRLLLYLNRLAPGLLDRLLRRYG